MDIRTQTLTRYIAPLREGGSLPALGEADDGFKYVVKLKGAGHGAKSLVGEFIGGMVAKAAKFNVPEYIFVKLDSLFGITEPDQEVQELLRKSEGLNLGLHFLDKAYTFDPKTFETDDMTAAKILWLDAFLTNVDRTRLNPNMMVWYNGLWLIDHGASLYFHHSWRNVEDALRDPFTHIKNHVFIDRAAQIIKADKLMRQALTPRTLEKIVDAIPTQWLSSYDDDIASSEKRKVYKRFLTGRLADTKPFVSAILNLQN